MENIYISIHHSKTANCGEPKIYINGKIHSYQEYLKKTIKKNERREAIKRCICCILYMTICVIRAYIFYKYDI